MVEKLVNRNPGRLLSYVVCLRREFDDWRAMTIDSKVVVADTS